MTMKWVFDLKDEDIYWCTADIGWVTGHSYIVYGPLAAGATVVMYEGAPNFPENDRFWRIIEKYRVNILYTAPTAIRTFIKWGDSWVEEARSVEPAAARHGRRADQSRSLDVVPQGDRRRALSDRRYLVADRNRRHHDRPDAGRDSDQAGIGDAADCRASPPRSSRARANPSAANQGGLLIVRRPWPGMLRTIFGDHERYQAAVFQPNRGRLLHRRRRAPRRGRLLLDHGPRRRRD